MIAPPTFDLVRAGVMRVAGWLVLLGLTLLCAPSAFAGDGEVRTHILTGPDDFTTSTTADFTFASNVADAEFWCRLDEGPVYVLCDGDTWHLEGLAPGPHSIQVYAYDWREDLVDETPATWEWTVEELPPPLDAGSPGDDGGVPGGDAGTGADGGSSGGDAGTGDADGGPSPSDAGTGDHDGGPAGGDAGTGGGDGGPSPSDAGTGGGDGGTSGDEDGGANPGGGEDGGTPAEDAGTANEDGGTGDGDGGTGDDAGRPDPVPPDDAPTSDALDYLGSGMGCTGAPAPGAVAGLLLLMLALRRRRGS
ncbi:hypothetical protein [Pyxidicoccus sp. MSG2]|uniref:hypothetical protein n=1 Tax=Pyxidicoccus sp. MSG2 TaxID=2996790 RepID=UPI00226D8C3D|nr:hypothetical protein [Pyxidicoccus sp. MSG2]MCY1018922.1 hypothetical protein [Pyxidicoccus sp. MSG2]